MTRHNVLIETLLFMRSIVYAFLFFAFSAWNQSAVQPDVYSISSRIFNSDRTISVYLPYSEDPADSLESYAVAYVFDGQFEAYTEMVSSMMQYYTASGFGVPMLVVGIHTENRWGEFVPDLTDSMQVKQQTGAEQLSRFLAEEVDPLIREQYHTKPFRLGVGHSLGGTFVLYEIMKENSLFQSVIAVSPNLTMYNEWMVSQGTDFFTRKPERPLFIYTSAGNSGQMERNFNSSLSRLDTAYQHQHAAAISFICRHLPEENHMTTFVPTFNSGYLELSSRLLLTESVLMKMVSDTSRSFVSQLNTFYTEAGLLSGENQTLSIERKKQVSKQLVDLDAYRAVIELCNDIKSEAAQADLTKTERKKLDELMDARIRYAEFNELANRANLLAEQHKNKEAADLYKQAFNMQVINGTHFVRMNAVRVFALAGEVDSAFEQLELLANKFELGGNSAFVNDPACESLKKDPRWKKYMDKLEKNAEKYR